MGQNPRRPGFRLRWGETERTDEAAAAEGAADQDAPATEAIAADAPTAAPAAAAHTPSEGAVTAEVAPAAPADIVDMPFLRDLVGAMRGVAESSRDSSLEAVRRAVEERVAELTAGGEEKAEELRRTADLDATGIGDWERTELERIRREAEQRRDTRRTELEKQLADHQAATDAEVEATRGRLSDHERELDAFFAQLSEITDPSAFVAAAKRMPPAPDLSKPAATKSSKAPSAEPASTEAGGKSATNGSAAAASPSNETLAQRLAQLDKQLGVAAPAGGAAESPEAPASATAATEAAATEASATEAAATTEPAAPEATPAPVPTPVPGTSGTGAATAVETSTAIVVKGLGSFGAITSFKQALERVDGVRGVTLSLGPTGDFVYRASHAADFDILGAIHSIEGPNAGIEQSEGSLVVTIAGPR